MRSLSTLALLALAAVQVAAAQPQEAEFLRQGAAYLEAQDYQRAARAYGRALRHNRQSAQAHQGLAMAYFRLGAGEAATNVELLDRAASGFREALRLSPDSDQLRYHLGFACLLLDDLNCAVREQAALKGLNADLARQLGSRIAAYRAPGSFQTLVGQPQGDDGTTTRVSIAGNSVLVPVSFSHRGSTVQATLILDTGASSTMITRGLASRLDLDLDRAPRGAVLVADGRRVQVWHAKLERVTVGSKSREGLEVVIVPEGGGKFPFDGLLGMNFLRNFKYSIDFGNQVINWSR